MRIATPLSRWLQRLQLATSCLGLFLIVITVAPALLHVWTTALSAPWGDEKGDILIVLGGDFVVPDIIGQSSYWRSFYGVRAWRTGHYRRIVVTGKNVAPLMRDFIVSQGVPPQCIIMENNANSTRENALYTRELLRGDAGRKVLLTSDFHMRRALGSFRKAGVEVSPAPIPDAHKRLNAWSQRWGVFWTLAEESAKIVYYEARGWM